jgi:hypothetical protein
MYKSLQNALDHAGPAPADCTVRGLHKGSFCASTARFQPDYATYAILITHMRFHIAKWSERLRIHALRLYDRRSRDFRS